MEKNLSCPMRVVFVLIALIFLLTLMFGKLFAVIGLLGSAFVAATGVCMASKVLGNAFCKSSVTDAVSKASQEIKDAAGNVVNDVKKSIKKD